MKPDPAITALLLDTTVIIDVLRNRNRRRAWLEQQILAGKSLATSAICIAEIHSGLRPGEEANTRAFLAYLEWIPVLPSMAEHAGRMKADFSRRGRTYSLLDLLIAATAMEGGLALVTDNQKHFQIHGLTLYPLP